MRTSFPLTLFFAPARAAGRCAALGGALLSHVSQVAWVRLVLLRRGSGVRIETFCNLI